MNRIAFGLLALGMAGLAFVSLVTVALVGLFGVSLLAAGRAVGRLRPMPAQAQARARARNDHAGEDRITRVWNDGRGTIIDM